MIPMAGYSVNPIFVSQTMPFLWTGPLAKSCSDSKSFQYDSQHIVFPQSSSVAIRVEVFPKKPLVCRFLARSRHISPKYFPITAHPGAKRPRGWFERAPSTKTTICSSPGLQQRHGGPSLAVDDDLVPVMVEDFPPRPVCLYKVGRPLTQSARPCFSADYVLDVWPVGRFPDDPRPYQFVTLDELLLHHRREGRRQPDSLGLDLPSELA
jgi:hypothetical protein